MPKPLLEGETKRKKKLHGFPKFLVIFLCSILGLALILVGLSYALFFDSATKTTDVRDNFANEQVVQEVLVDSFDNTSTKKAVSIELTENVIDQLLYNTGIENASKWDALKTSLYCTIDDNNYNFYLQLTVPLFKTRAVIQTTLEENENSDFIFTIKDIKLGRLGLYNIVAGVIPESAIKTVEDKMKEAGLEVKIDLKEQKMVLTKESYASTIEKAASGSDVGKFLKELIGDENVFHVNTVGGLGAELNLEYLATNPTYFKNTRSVEKMAIQDMSMKMTGIKKLMDTYTFKDDSKGVLIDVAKLNLMLKYFLKGYDNLYETEKDQIYTLGNKLKGLGFISVDTDPTSYTEKYGHVFNPNPSNISIGNTIVDTFKNDPTATQVSITDDDLQAVLAGAASGTIFPLYRNLGGNDNPNFKINYVSLNDTYTLSTPTAFTILFDVDFSGYHTQLGLVTSPKTGVGDNKIQFSFSDGGTSGVKPGIYFGKHEVTGELKSFFTDQLKTAFSGQDLFNLTNDYLELDLSSLISQFPETLGISKLNPSIQDGKIVVTKA